MILSLNGNIDVRCYSIIFFIFIKSYAACIILNKSLIFLIMKMSFDLSILR